MLTPLPVFGAMPRAIRTTSIPWKPWKWTMWCLAWVRPWTAFCCWRGGQREAGRGSLRRRLCSGYPKPSVITETLNVCYVPRRGLPRIVTVTDSWKPENASKALLWASGNRRRGSSHGFDQIDIVGRHGSFADDRLGRYDSLGRRCKRRRPPHNRLFACSRSTCRRGGEDVFRRREFG